MLQKGDTLGGTFQLSFSNDVTTQKTSLLTPYESANNLKAELEKLSNIGRVSVTRSYNHTSTTLYWDVEFIVEGNLAPLIPVNVNLIGSIKNSILVSEIVTGTGPGF